MTERGWTDSRDELIRVRLLDWVYRHTQGDTMPDFDAFLAEHADVSEQDLEAAARTLEHAGHIKIERGLAGILNSAATTTSAGTAVARSRHERRQNYRARAVAAREALLDWFYVQKREGKHFPLTDTILQDPRGHFEGDPFTKQELQDAGEHLLAKGMIKAVGALGAPVIRGAIVAKGEDVVENHESSLTSWTAATQRGSQQFVTHFNGAVSGQVGIGESVTQTMTNNTGMDPATVVALLSDIREAAGQTVDSERARLLAYIDVIQAEVTADEPNPGLVRSSVDRVKAIAAKAGDAGLSASVGALVSYVLTFV